MSDDHPPPMQAGLVKSLGLILPLGIAVLSLVSSIYQSWNYSRNIESAQRNILRAESLRTCRDIIDVFFQFRLKSEEASMMREAGNPMLQAELKAIVYKFGGFGTFLANFQDEAARKRYTELTWEMLFIAENATKLPKDDFAKRFAKIDESFGKLNEDCVKAAQSKLL
jgi:hypothetical protein